MVDYNLTVQIVDKATNQPLPWGLILDGQHLGDVGQSSYTVVLPEGNHVLELPIVIGSGYASIVWRDQAGNILGNATTLSLNLVSDQQITLTLEIRGGLPPYIYGLVAIISVSVVGLVALTWWVSKKIFE